MEKILQRNILKKTTEEDVKCLPFIISLEMSSSTSNNNSSSKVDFRFSTKSCACGKKTLIKVVETKKPSKGKPYFACATNNCKTFGWWIPDSATSNTPTACGNNNWTEDGCKDLVAELRLLVAEMKNETKAKLMRLEENFEGMKTLVLICIGMSIVAIIKSVFV